MIDLLLASPLLTLFATIALGTLVGAIPFGPLRFGPAGALFVGLALGALEPELGEGLGLVQSIGLGLFVYTVGIAAGRGFFRDLRRQLPLMAWSVLLLVVLAVVSIVLVRVLGLDAGVGAGAFAGALTSTPALAAATTAAGGGQEAAVGYSIAYPVGVVVAIAAVAVILNRPWTGRADPESAAAAGLTSVTAEATAPMARRDIPGLAEHRVRISYLRRGDEVRVLRPGEDLEAGDRVLVVGPEAEVAAAVTSIGVSGAESLVDDRRVVDFRRWTVSNPDVAGRSVADLDIAEWFSGVLTRVRSGDIDLLAAPDTVLELGDRVLVVAPATEMDAVTRFFGDSERKVSEVDALTLGIGMALGLLLGMIALPLPGGIVLSLGAAAGPLVVGLVLGYVERTGPFVWVPPQAANFTLRQLGLLLFLAAVGLASGEAFASQVLSATGAKVLLLAATVGAVGAIGMIVLGRGLGISAPRTAGALAGFVGQPAILAYANGRTVDERIDAGYAPLFALGLMVKIVLVQVIVAAT